MTVSPRLVPRLARAALTAAPWLALGLIAWRVRPTPPTPALSLPDQDSPESFAEREPGRGRLAAGPLRIPPRGWKDILWRTAREFGQDQLPRVAAGITFYALLALAPALAVFVSLYGLIADIGQVQAQLDQMAAVIPADVLQIVGDQMRRLAVERTANLSLAFAFSLLLSIWTASNAVRALVDGMNIAYDEAERRNIVQLTALTYAATFGALVFLIMVSGLLVAAPIGLKLAGLTALAPVLGPVRWMVLLGVAALAFMVLYRYGPCRRRALWRWAAPGAAFAACAWLLGSLGFSWYLNNIAAYHATYGSLGAVIGFMMWVWLSILIVLLGAELNAEIEHQTAVDSTIGPERPMGRRGAAMADSVGLAQTASPLGALRRAGTGVRRIRLPGRPGARPGPRRSGG